MAGAAEGLRRDPRVETVCWATWGCCLPRALLEGIGASPSSVFTGVIIPTHTLMYTHIDT